MRKVKSERRHTPGCRRPGASQGCPGLVWLLLMFVDRLFRRRWRISGNGGAEGRVVSATGTRNAEGKDQGL